MKLWLTIILIIAVVLLILSWPRTLQDHQVQGLRIVSLSPAITEILFELGLGQQIVGTAEYSDFPPQAKQIPRVGAYGEANIEIILRTKPQLLISQRISPEKMKLLQSKISPLCPVLLLKLDTLDEIIDSVQKIAQASGTSKRARDLTSTWQKKLEQLNNRFAHLAQADRVSVYVEVGSNPLRTCGPGTYLSEIISLVGGKNLGDATGSLWPVIASETVVAWNPDIILITGMKRSGDFKKEISSRLGWGNIRAVKTGWIIELGDAYQRQGPRLFEKLEELADLLQPSARRSRTR